MEQPKPRRYIFDLPDGFPVRALPEVRFPLPLAERKHFDFMGLPAGNKVPPDHKSRIAAN